MGLPQIVRRCQVSGVLIIVNVLEMEMKEIREKVFQLNFGSLGDFDIWEDKEHGCWYAQHMSQYGDSACLMGEYATFELAAERALSCAMQILKIGRWN